MEQVVKVILEDGTTYEYVFDTPPTQEQLNSAMDGIGGRPPNRVPPKNS